MKRAVARGNGGFTVMEALTALLVVTTVVRIALPEIHAFFKRAQAGEVVEAVRTVRAAAERFHAERTRWPADALTGEVPPDLETYLPEGFRFEGAGFRLDWERWALPDGIPDAPTARGLVGVSVVTPDAALGQAVLRLLQDDSAPWMLGDTYTVLFARIP